MNKKLDRLEREREREESKRELDRIRWTGRRAIEHQDKNLERKRSIRGENSVIVY